MLWHTYNAITLKSSVVSVFVPKNGKMENYNKYNFF